MPDGSWQRSAKDKGGRPLLLIADRNGPSLLVRAFRQRKKGHEAVLLASIDGETATIRDIGCFGANSLNQGIGTALLAFAEEILADQGVRTVVGWLSPGDIGHRDRQSHFYLKNGYQVRLTGQTGRITKGLDASVWVRNDWPGRS